MLLFLPLVASANRINLFLRLLELAPLYYDLSEFPDGETKRALQQIQKQKTSEGSRKVKKRKAE